MWICYQQAMKEKYSCEMPIYREQLMDKFYKRQLDTVALGNP